MTNKASLGTVMNDSAGDWIDRMLQSFPPAYTMWFDGSEYHGEANIQGGDDFNEDEASVVFQLITDTTGGAIFVKKATVPYIILDPISLANSQSSIISDGATLTCTESTGDWATGTRGIFELPNKNDVTIQGLNFSLGGLANAIVSKGHNGLHINHNKFSGNPATFNPGGVIFLNGLEATANMDNTFIENNIFTEITSKVRPIRIYPTTGRTSRNIWISNNSFENTYGRAIDLDAFTTCQKVSVINNKFRDLRGDEGATAYDYALAVGSTQDQGYQISNVEICNNEYTNTRNSQRVGFAFLYSLQHVIISDNQLYATGTSPEGPAFALGKTSDPIKNVVIDGNIIEGFDALWDPDSMENVEVSNNIGVNSTNPFAIGYNTQKNVNIHHNTLINCINPGYPAAIFMGAVTTCKKITYENNLHIDDRVVPVMTYAIELTGDADFSDVIVRNNRIYVPNGPVDWLLKEGGLEVSPRIIKDMELEDSASVRFTENSGTSTGTGAEQTIAHGLVTTPNRVWFSDIENGANPYQSSAADTTNIYVLATINQDYAWKAEVV